MQLFWKMDTGRRNLYLLSFLAFMVMTGFGLVMPLLPIYVKLLGGSATELGVLMASFMLTRAVFATGFGNISDRIGRKKIILGGVVLYGVLSIVFALSTEMWELLLARLIQGISSAMVWPVSEALIIDSVEPAERGYAMSVYMVFSNAGMAAGPFLGGALLYIGREHFHLPVLDSYRFPFYFTAIIMFMAFVAVLIFVKDILPPLTEKEARDRKEGIKTIEIEPEVRRSLRVLYANGLMNGFAMGLVSSILVYYISIRFFPYDDATAGTAIAVIMGLATLSGMFVAIPAGKIADRIGRKPQIIIGGYISRIATIFMPFMPTAALAGNMVLLRFSAFNVTSPAFRALQADLIPEKIRGKLIGFLQTMFNTGAIVGPIIGGILFDAFSNHRYMLGPLSVPGESFPFILSGGVGILTITLIWLYVKEPDRK